MNIQQLRDYLDALLASGTDPLTPVCVTSDEEASEVSDIAIVDGPFREDPAPKMPAFLNSKGTFVFLATSDDYDWMVHDRYPRIDGPEVPQKQWRPGEEWWLGDRGNSQSHGLMIFSGKVSSNEKITEAINLRSNQAGVVQSLHSPGVLTALSVEDPPEIGMAWTPQAGVAHDVRTRVFVGGVPEEEHERLEALSRRGLVAVDIPNEPWRDDYASYELREDGAILADGVSVELGWVNSATGTVNWVRLQGAHG